MEIFFEPEDEDFDIVFEPEVPDLGAEVACLNCGGQVVPGVLTGTAQTVHACIGCSWWTALQLPSSQAQAILVQRIQSGPEVIDGK